MSSSTVNSVQSSSSLRCDERAAMLIYSMNVSVDGFIADREDASTWTAPIDELFRFHLAHDP